MFLLKIFNFFVMLEKLPSGAMVTGEILKKKREEMGLDIAAVADLLKIRADYLASIEDDSFEKLPPLVYTLGYVRTYASYLGVDADALVRYYSEHLSPPEHTTIIPVGYSQKRIPKLLAVIPMLLIAVAAFFVFPLFRKQAATVPVSLNKGFAEKKVPAIPAEVKEPLPAPASPVQNSGKESNPSQEQAAVISKDVEPEKHSLDITAVETTWISIKFKDGKTEEVLFRPGETKNWRFPETAFLKIGNAGGIQLRFDGKDLGAPGEPGQVKDLTLPYN
jgi:cytoskeleton protein RodZ